jgi:hypothetical protein
MNHETFWLKDPSQLFTPQTWVRFVPMDWMTVPESLNAVLRFTIYFSAILSIVTGKTQYLFAIPTVALVTVFLERMYPETQSFKEAFKNAGKYTMPTPRNPFMNVTLDEISDNPNRPPAAPIDRPDVAEGVETAFSKTSELFMDTSDRFDLMQSSRAFAAMGGSGTVPNDLDAYQEFLNKDNVSRKLDSESYVSARGSVFESKGRA